MSKLIIAGGSGLIGQRLIDHLSPRFKDIVVLSRGEPKVREKYRRVKWDGKNLGDWSEVLNGCEVLINLSGKSIQTRFTEANKRVLLSSRIEPTQVLGKAIEQVEKPPRLWLNASGAAIYPVEPIRSYDERSHERSRSFLGQLSEQWESAFFAQTCSNTRQVAMRITPVLNKEEGVYPTLARLTKFGLGGAQGSGKQHFSWIHIVDLCAAVEHIISLDKAPSVVNMAAPEHLTNKDFMKALRKSLGVPIGLPAPSPAIHLGSLLTGVDPALILDNSSVKSHVLPSTGFQFSYPLVASAFEALKS